MKKIGKKFCNKETMMKLLMFFLILQPLLDIYVLFEPEVVEFFKFSPATIIRIAFMGILSLFAIFTIKWTKKHIWMIVYGGLVLGYVILHHINAMHFVSNVPGNFGYSLLSELFYIIRMLLPLIMIVLSYHFEFKDEKMEKVVMWLVILFSGSIVLCNLLGVALTSYTNERIGGNIFDWFSKNPLSYRALASKGFFTFANQIAALELLLTPILIYYFYKHPTKKNIALVFLQLLATFMIGTKVATFGFLILFVGMTILYFFFCFAKKEVVFSKKVLFSSFCFGILAAILLPVSPMLNRNQTSDLMEENFEEEIKCKTLAFDTSDPYHYQVREEEILVEDSDACITQNEREKKKIDFVNQQLEKFTTKNEKENYLKTFIEVEYANFRINERFIEKSYPYQYDPYFWYETMQLPLIDRLDYRYLEQRMLKQVKSLNDNQKDDWFGITYSRMSNIFNFERDFLSHYYSLGWFGLGIFLGPYLILLGICLIRMLLHFKKQFTLRHCAFAAGIGIVLFAAFYSGNVMDGLVVTLILGFFIGQFLKSTTEKNNE